MAKNGLHLITPTSIAYTGTSASISANGSVSFSAVSSISLNGVFSADYDNYMIVGWNSSAGNNSLPLRWRASGTDNSTASSYTNQYWFVDGTAISAARTSDAFTYLSGSRSTQRSGFVAVAYGPYLAQPTAHRTCIADDYNNATVWDHVSTHNQSVSYDGFTMYQGGAFTFSGRIAVYGMRK